DEPGTITKGPISLRVKEANCLKYTRQPSSEISLGKPLQEQAAQWRQPALVTSSNARVETWLALRGTAKLYRFSILPRNNDRTADQATRLPLRRGGLPPVEPPRLQN